MNQILSALQRLNIPYTTHTHPAVFTSAEAAQYYDIIPGAHVKNLFLRNRKGDHHYLVVVLDHKKIDLRALEQVLGEKQLGFASAERLQRHLKVTPGSVSVLGLIFDNDHAVQVIIDADCAQSQQINFHPNDNTLTLTIAWPDFERFLQWCGNPVQTVTL